MTFSPYILGEQFKSAQKRKKPDEQEKTSLTTTTFVSQLMMFGSQIKKQASVKNTEKSPWTPTTDPFNN